jgi:hypothetical protein
MKPLAAFVRRFHSKGLLDTSIMRKKGEIIGKWKGLIWWGLREEGVDKVLMAIKFFTSYIKMDILI